jgi:hypothetical protein
MSDIAKCPDCGMAPEFVWRGTGPAVRFAALKCSNNHYRVEIGYHDGAQETARKNLIVKWNEKVNGVKK